jgi:anti-sigma regulatory factor (Ser/Thr protein kinase)
MTGVSGGNMQQPTSRPVDEAPNPVEGYTGADPVQLQEHHWLPAHPVSAGEARRLVRAFVLHAGQVERLDSAELLVSEVVTNALLYTAQDVRLFLSADEQGLRVEVYDHSPRVPVVSAGRDPDASTGRGLALLGLCADAWGADPRPGGKVVWFRLGSGPLGEAAHTRVPVGGSPRPYDATPAPGDTLQVQLRNAPSRLLRSWVHDADAVLRDYLLAETDRQADPEAVLTAYAEASEAVALVRDHAGARLRACPRAGSSHAHINVSIPIPRAAARHFDALGAVLARAAAPNEMASSPTGSQEAAFRSMTDWLCGQVREQNRGCPPEPWDTPAQSESA